jgi:D-amino-acid dehydrogenase
LEQLQKIGVDLHEEHEINRFVLKDGLIKAVISKNDEFDADQFVIAAGTWSPTLTKQLQISMPMQAGKGYSFTVPNPVELPETCSILTEAKVAVTPIEDSLRFAGTMEITGLDSSISNSRVNGIKKSILSYFPSFKMEDFDALEIWSGLRPCSPDGIPYIGRTGKYSNLVVATGHGMMGMSMGPVTGKLVSQICSSQETEIDLHQCAPERFQ